MTALAERITDVLDLSVSELCLSARARNCLLRSGICTTGDLATWTARQLLDLPAFGRTSLEDVEGRLAEHGLALEASSQLDRPAAPAGKPPSPFAADLGSRLRKIREQRGKSLMDIQVESGGKWPAVVVGSWERGNRNPTVNRLHDLCEYYKIPLSEMLDPPPLVAAAFVAITGAAASGERERIRKMLIEEAEKPRWNADLNGVRVIAFLAELIGGPL